MTDNTLLIPEKKENNRIYFKSAFQISGKVLANAELHQPAVIGNSVINA